MFKTNHLNAKKNNAEEIKMQQKKEETEKQMDAENSFQLQTKLKRNKRKELWQLLS